MNHVSPTSPRHVGRRLRRRGLLAGAVAAGLLLTGCGGGTGNEDAVADDGSVDLSKVTLIVGDQRSSSVRALLEAADLADTPYDIEWKEFTSGPPMLESINAGAVHVGLVGNTPPLFAAAAQGQFKMVQAVTFSGKGDAILVPKDSPIESVADLAGKDVGVAVGSSANYHLLAQLGEAGVGYDEIEVKNLQPADALVAFTTGSLDAWAVWDPFTSQAVIDEGARVLVDGEGLVNGYNFQVASDEAIDDTATAAALEDYLARVTEAQLWSGEHQQEWADVWAEQTGLTPEVTLAAAKQRPVTIVPIDEEVIASEQEMADAFTENGLLPESVDVADYFSDAFNDVTATQQSPTAGAAR
ncbi:ABC transporter substrate-binding protein [Nocardioides sp. Leaf374]|uniref:ABC transporter substrate-binding protein n=1 Tax=Nocardioides sp. Leaf374 TaxID=2876560 RepID=UPI001E2D8F50|nr:ABC transporter substrate-binding protein [Nocardioides sp. Leaf374]